MPNEEGPGKSKNPEKVISPVRQSLFFSALKLEMKQKGLTLEEVAEKFEADARANESGPHLEKSLTLLKQAVEEIEKEQREKN